MKFLFLVTALLLNFCAAYAEPEQQRKTEFSGLPFAFYSSETGIGGGLFSSITTSDFILRNGRLSVFAIAQATQKKQVVLNVKPRYNTGDYTFEVPFAYVVWPQSFYGIGINSNLNDEVKFTSIRHEFSLDIRKRVFQKWTFGLYGNYADYSLKNIAPNSLLVNTTGSKGGSIIGVGASLSYDTRNSLFFSTEGDYFELQYLDYNSLLGSEFQFKSSSLDLRKFYSFATIHSLGFQFYSEYQFGSPPFQKMKKLGDYLRAYESTRYIDKGILALRSEYRIFPWFEKWYNRIGFVLFAESGTVFDELNDLSFKNVKFSGGFGTRFKLSKGDGILLRFDLGFSNESFNMAVLGTEAF